MDADAAVLGTVDLDLLVGRPFEDVLVLLRAGPFHHAEQLLRAGFAVVFDVELVQLVEAVVAQFLEGLLLLGQGPGHLIACAVGFIVDRAVAFPWVEFEFAALQRADAEPGQVSVAGRLYLDVYEGRALYVLQG